MKKLLLALTILFVVLTFIGGGYVLSTKGEANPGYGAVPMIWALVCLVAYRKKSDRKGNE